MMAPQPPPPPRNSACALPFKQHVTNHRTEPTHMPPITTHQELGMRLPAPAAGRAPAAARPPRCRRRAELPLDQLLQLRLRRLVQPLQAALCVALRNGKMVDTGAHEGLHAMRDCERSCVGVPHSAAPGCAPRRPAQGVVVEAEGLEGAHAHTTPTMHNQHSLRPSPPKPPTPTAPRQLV